MRTIPSTPIKSQAGLLNGLDGYEAELAKEITDFGYSKLTDKWLARKYRMPIDRVRQIRRRFRRNRQH